MATDNNENKDIKDNTETKPKQNNWKVFCINILIVFGVVFGLGLLGSNFVYFTRIDLDKMFPSKVDQRPYTDESKSGNKLPPMFPNKTGNTNNLDQSGGRKMKGGSQGSGCGVNIDFTQCPLLDNKYFSGMFEYGFPYSMESKKDTFGGIITNWFVNKVKYSYIWQRMFIANVIDFVGSTCGVVPESMKDIIPFIIGPIVICFIILITSLWWIPTLVSVFWNETQDLGMIISIIGLFFGWTWFVPIVLTFIQVIGILFSFILLPVLLNGKKIMEIMRHKYNSYYLILLLLIATIVIAFVNLNIMVAVPMLLVCIYSLWSARPTTTQTST